MALSSALWRTVHDETRQWRRGWHFTATRNLESIKRDGLIPYAIAKPECDVYCVGIYTWLQRPTGESLAGIIVQRIHDHHAWSVTLLSYLFRPLDTHPRGRDVMTLYHDGRMFGNDGSSWSYHTKEPSMALLDPVPPARIRIEQTWDVGEFLTGQPIEE